MLLWLTVVDAIDASVSEVLVRAPAGSDMRELRPHLPGRVSASDPTPELFVGSRLLAEDDGLGLPPLLDGVVIHVGAPSATSDPAPSGLLWLDVTSGPDAGRSYPLALGRHVVGRAPSADVTIDDLGLSRAHAVIQVTDTATLVSDLGSTNGSQLDGRPLTGTPGEWRVGARLRVGDSVLELQSHGSASAATTFDGEGGIVINRRPRDITAAPDVLITFPEQPMAPPRGRLPLLALLVPLLVAAPMAWLQHSPAYLLFGLMSPAMMAGNFISDRRGGRRTERRAVAAWHEGMARAGVHLEQALSCEASRRRADAPDPAEVLRTAQTPLARLWERRPGDADFGRLRIGCATVQARVRRVGPSPRPDGDGSTVDQLSGDSQPHLDDVPLVVDLARTGVLGLAGPTCDVHGLARNLLAQLAGWHSPRDVRLFVLVAKGSALGSWTWVARLPHTRLGPTADAYAAFAGPSSDDQLRRRITELNAVLENRLSQLSTSGTSDTRRTGPLVVVIFDGSETLRRVPGVARILELGPSVGIHAICLDRDRSHLPVECSAVVEMAGSVDEESAVRVSGSVEAGTAIVVDRVSLDWVEQFSRAMAPYRDGTPDQISAEPPEEARLVDLLDLDPGRSQTLENRWRTTPRSTRAVLGATADGPFTVDLRHDGPHILIGGTTGAGKSELLRTLIASLAIANAPDQLGFVLVDYKGGSAFDACADLPHTLGLVTDLDPQLAERALRSMHAELTRREMVLRTLGAKDLDDYQRLAGPGAAVVPRLVLVIDEFRMLAEELPSFIDGLVRIAAVGRSLGVHLVLATQRPAGIVSADIATNVNLRIALRVRDQVDSEDVIEARDAAAISAGRPGRAFARSGANPLIAFQTARVSGGARDEPLTLEVVTLDPTQIGEPLAFTPRRDPQAQSGASDLRGIVAATREAAEHLHRPPTRRPWLPPLPDLITIDDLARPTRAFLASYAVVDRPDQQAQETVTWDLSRDGHLLIAGTARTGRSSCLRTIAGAVAESASPRAVHIHVIEGVGGSLQAIGRLPHAGVVAGGDETARGVRLLDRLQQEVKDRQSALTAAGFGSLGDQHGSVDEADRIPHVVLLLDGWESLVAAWEQVDHGRPVETVQQLMREGPSVGLKVVVTGDRSLLVSRIASLITDRLVLRLADPADLVLAGIPTAATPRHWPAGRALRVSDQSEVQVALLARERTTAAQTAALSLIAHRAAGSDRPTRQAHRPLQIETLPARADYSEVATRSEHRPGAWALVGLGGDAAEPVGLPLPGSFTVAGPARSGRSTTMATIARSLAGRDQPVLVITDGPPSAPWSTLAGHSRLHLVDARDPAAVRELIEGREALSVLVDDVDRIQDTEAEDLVHQWFKSVGAMSGSLFVAGTTTDLSASFRGLSVLTRRSGSGVLLNPTTYADGDLLGVRISLGEASLRIPGRGLLLHDGQAMPVQVAR